MRGDIVLSGFVLTAEEWDSMDSLARAQLLRAGSRRDEPWPAAGPPSPRRREVEEPYEAYELVAVSG